MSAPDGGIFETCCSLTSVIFSRNRHVLGTFLRDGIALLRAYAVAGAEGGLPFCQRLWILNGYPNAQQYL